MQVHQSEPDKLGLGDVLPSDMLEEINGRPLLKFQQQIEGKAELIVLPGGAHSLSGIW